MHLALRQDQRHIALTVDNDGTGYRVTIGDTVHRVLLEEAPEGTAVLVIDGRRWPVTVARRGSERYVAVAGHTFRFSPERGGGASHGLDLVASPEISAPMPGKVLRVLVEPGAAVAAGDGLVILEAMKMENRLVAEAAATIAEVRVQEGDMVDAGQVLLVLRYAEAEADPTR